MAPFKPWIVSVVSILLAVVLVSEAMWTSCATQDAVIFERGTTRASIQNLRANWTTVGLEGTIVENLRASFGLLGFQEIQRDSQQCYENPRGIFPVVDIPDNGLYALRHIDTAMLLCNTYNTSHVVGNGSITLDAVVTEFKLADSSSDFYGRFNVTVASDDINITLFESTSQGLIYEGIYWYGCREGSPEQAAVTFEC